MNGTRSDVSLTVKSVHVQTSMGGYLIRNFMKKIITVVLALYGLALPLRAVAQEKFRAASGGFSTAIHALLWLAYEKKIFQKYGLDGEYLALESGTPAMQALLANELQIVFTTGALAI